MKRLALLLFLIGIPTLLSRDARADGQCCHCPEVVWKTNINCQTSNCAAVVGIYTCWTFGTPAGCEKCVSRTVSCCGTNHSSKTEGPPCGPPGTGRILAPRDLIFPAREGGYLPGTVTFTAQAARSSGASTP